MAKTGTRRRDFDPGTLVTTHVLTVAGVVAVLAVTAVLGRFLVGSHDPAEPSYVPVPDAQLFSAIAALKGVADVQVTYDDQAVPPAYSGTVSVDHGRRLCPVLDQVFAILRQGHHGALIHVTVARSTDGPPRRTLQMEDVDAAVAADPGSRYGAQPGTGEPLDDRLCSPES